MLGVMLFVDEVQMVKAAHNVVQWTFPLRLLLLPSHLWQLVSQPLTSGVVPFVRRIQLIKTVLLVVKPSFLLLEV